MADFRLCSDDGAVVDSASFDADPEAISWRSRHPFTEAGAKEGRQLRLEKLVDGAWVGIAPLGTSEAS